MLRRGTLAVGEMTGVTVSARWLSVLNLGVRLLHTDNSTQVRRYVLAERPALAVSTRNEDTTISVDLRNVFHEPMLNPLPVTVPNRLIRAAAATIALPLSSTQSLLCESRFRRDIDPSSITTFMTRRLVGSLLREVTHRQKLSARFKLDRAGDTHDGVMEVATGDTLFDIQGGHGKLPGRCLSASFLTRKDVDSGLVIALGVESVASIFQNTSVALFQLFKGAITRPLVGVPRPLSPAGEQRIKHLADFGARIFTPCGKVYLVFPEGPAGPCYVALRGTVFPSALVEVVVARPDGSESLYRSTFLTPYRNPMALGLRNFWGLETSWNTVVFHGSSIVAVPQEVPDWVKRKYESVLPVEDLTHSLTDVMQYFEERPLSIQSSVV